MSKFIFTNIVEDGVITHEISATHIHSVVERFEDFLRGCGFVFNGHLEVVDDSVIGAPYDLNYNYNPEDFDIKINLDDYGWMPQSLMTDDIIKPDNC